MMNMFHSGYSGKINSNSGVDPGVFVGANSKQSPAFKHIFNDLNQPQSRQQDQEQKDTEVINLLSLSAEGQQQRLKEMSPDQLKELSQKMEISFKRFMKNLKETDLVDGNLSVNFKQILREHWYNLKQQLTEIMQAKTGDRIQNLFSKGEITVKRLQQVVNGQSEKDDLSAEILSLLNEVKQGKQVFLTDMSTQELNVFRQQLEELDISNFDYDLLNKSVNDFAVKDIDQLKRQLWQLKADVEKLIVHNNKFVVDLHKAGISEEKLKRLTGSDLVKLTHNINGLQLSERNSFLLKSTNTTSRSDILDVLSLDDDKLSQEIKSVLATLLDPSSTGKSEISQLERLNGEQLELIYKLIVDNKLEEIISLKGFNQDQVQSLQNKYSRLQQVISGLFSEKTGKINKEFLNQYLHQESLLKMKTGGEDTPRTEQIQPAGSEITSIPNNNENAAGWSGNFSHPEWQNLITTNWQNTGQELTFNQQVQRFEVVNQIMEQVQLNHQSGINKLELQLKPEFLGKVKLDLELKGGEIKVRFQVENLFVKHHLEQNIQGLKSNLIKQGFEIDHLSIENNNQEGNLDYGSQSHDNSEQNQNQQQEQEYNPSYYSKEQVQKLMEVSPEELAEMRLKFTPWMVNDYMRMNILA